jgi:hypothetical protein
MSTLRTLTTALRCCAIATAAACGGAPDAALSPVASEPSLALVGTTCSSKSATTIALAVGSAKRLTDKEAACLNFKSIDGSRYLLAYVDTRLVNKAKTQAESPWPDSAIVRVEDVSGSVFSTIGTSDVPTRTQTLVAPRDVSDGASALMVPSGCPLLNSSYPFCRARPYRVGEVITHYPGNEAPAGKATILTIVGNLAVAAFEPDAGLLVPNVKARTDSALTWIVKRNIPLLQSAFSLRNPTTTSDESGQLYIGLQAASGSSAQWWSDAANGSGRWAKVLIGLSPSGGFSEPSLSYTSALQVLGHETMHTYQYRWRYEHASPWQSSLGTKWAVEGGASFFAQEMIRDRLGIPFSGNTVFSASTLQDPTFALLTYGFKVRNFTSGYSDAASMLRDFVQRLVGGGMPLDDALSQVLLGAMEGWYGINEDNQEHGAGLTSRMQRVLGSSWNPTDALLQWTMSEAADDLTSNSTYQNLTKRAYSPSTATNNIRPDALIVPGSSVSVSRGPGTTGVFEIDGTRGATYRASGNTLRTIFATSPIEWLILRIQ